MDTPYIVWFDIDSTLSIYRSNPPDNVCVFVDTLYSAQTGIANQMGRRIQDYFKHTFPGDPKGAEALHLEYYTKHGLALRYEYRFPCSHGLRISCSSQWFDDAQRG